MPIKQNCDESDFRTIDAVKRNREVRISVDGEPLSAFEGETVAATLLASGKRGLRTTARCQEPRGMYCGIGLCFDCVMVIDGQPNTRACQTLVREGMHVESQAGEGPSRVEP